MGVEFELILNVQYKLQRQVVKKKNFNPDYAKLNLKYLEAKPSQNLLNLLFTATQILKEILKLIKLN